MKYNSFRPGQVWLDTEGKRIQAHGGSVIYIDGTYYFYGENGISGQNIYLVSKCANGQASYHL